MQKCLCRFFWKSACPLAYAVSPSGNSLLTPSLTSHVPVIYPPSHFPVQEDDNLLRLLLQQQHLLTTPSYSCSAVSPLNLKDIIAFIIGVGGSCSTCPYPGKDASHLPHSISFSPFLAHKIDAGYVLSSSSSLSLLSTVVATSTAATCPSSSIPGCPI